MTLALNGDLGGTARETAVRLTTFFAVLLLMMLWEYLAPRRHWRARRGVRWVSNLSLVALNTAAVRLLLPLTAVLLAEIAARREWGVLNVVAWPAAVEFAIGLLALDFAIYLQHVMFHSVPLFWRLHRVHHADLDIDATTGVRFHSVEILLSMGIKMGVVLMLGPSPWCVVTFEALLNATSMFNHANVRMPPGVDRVLRRLVVTPDMHRVHHSVIREETNSNFGFNLPWWDWICGTYRAQPAAGHEEMTIGLNELRDEHRTSPLHRILLMPFIRTVRDAGSGREGAGDFRGDAFPNAGKGESVVENGGGGPYHPARPRR